MGLFRRTKSATGLSSVPFRQRVLRDRTVLLIAADEMAAALHLASINSADVFPGSERVCVLFTEFEDVGSFLELALGDDPSRPGGIKDRASSGCITAAYEGAAFPGMSLSEDHEWVWDFHPSWDTDGGGIEWHVNVAIPLEDALAVTAAMNSKRHGDSL